MGLPGPFRLCSFLAKSCLCGTVVHRTLAVLTFLMSWLLQVAFLSWLPVGVDCFFSWKGGSAPGPNMPVRIPRGRPDLRSGFAADTTDRMAWCLAAFRTWVAEELLIDFGCVCVDSESVALALRAYGRRSWLGIPDAFSCVLQLLRRTPFPSHRKKLTAAWRVDKKWQQNWEKRRPVISAPWGWPRAS